MGPARASRQNGSAPRVRGTLAVMGWLVVDGRFSPARAGNTQNIAAATFFGPVQPRACGEHVFLGRLALTNDGSAPRVRGTPVMAKAHACAARFSPARAGNTARFLFRVQLLAVQPRACGEHRPCHRNSGRAVGSAPRVRGTRLAAAVHLIAQRFSPARAGNTCAGCYAIVDRTVQPRACGEHRQLLQSIFWPPGSAPRVRGTLDSIDKENVFERFSPARAGNTLTIVTWPMMAAVQPRACGEHYRLKARYVRCGGSAPRVRGTR